MYRFARRRQRRFLPELFRRCFTSKNENVRGSLYEKGMVKQTSFAAGDFIAADRRFCAEDVRSFSNMIDDANPIHTRSGVVQGHLCSSMFGALLGSSFPGCLYMSQTAKYRTVLHVDTDVTATVTVERVRRVRDDRVVLLCKTECATRFETPKRVIVDGKAMVSIDAIAV